MSIRLRPLLAVAVCAALAAGTGVAAAAPAPACNLVTDAKDDGLVEHAALEILSADIATDAKAKKLTTVIRVVKASTTSSVAPTGLKWQFSWKAGDRTLFTSALSDPVNGVTGKYGYTDTSGNILGDAVVVIDTKTNEIRVTVPTVAFASQIAIKPKMEFSSFSVSAQSVLQAPRGLVNVRVVGNDTATGTSSYAVSAPSCVRAGK